MFVRYDATFSGLLSATAFCFRSRLQPQGLISEQDEQPIVDCLSIPREANIRRLFRCHLQKAMGDGAAEAVLDTTYRAFLSEQAGIADHILRYLALALEWRQDPAPRLFEPDVAAVAQAARRVSGQAHQFLGLLRFREVLPAFLLADFAPDYHLLPLIMPHFADRMSGQRFAIRDLRRNLLAFHPPGGPISIQILIEDDDVRPEDALPGIPGPGRISLPVMPPGLSSGSPGSPDGSASAYEAMWRRYLKHLSIPERSNPKLQKANLPQKYWKYLTEDPGS